VVDVRSLDFHVIDPNEELEVPNNPDDHENVQEKLTDCDRANLVMECIFPVNVSRKNCLFSLDFLVKKLEF
jgi:hypothetical protein